MDAELKVPGYYEISVEVGHEAMEAVADFLLRQGAGGLLYDEGSVSLVRAYFRPEVTHQVVELLNAHLDQLPEWGLSTGEPQVSLRFVADADWANAWREHYHVQRIGKRLVIRPVWESYEPKDGDVVIDMEPGMAFGTGEHPTTALCLEALDALVRPGQRVADVGTGSGILAIAAAKLGARMVDAVDVDPEAVSVARQNVEVNGVSGLVRVFEGGVRQLILPGSEPYDIIVMNIVADVIIDLLPELVPLVGPQTELLLSGIIETRREDVAAALSSCNLQLRSWTQRGEWLLARAGR